MAPPAPISFEGHVALVTGGSRGLGRAIADLLSDLGARVFVADIAPPADTGGASTFLECDVSDERAVEIAVETLCRDAGRLDVLVNNAGVIEPIAKTTSQRSDAWQHVIDVNLRGTYLMSREAGRVMLAQGSGAVVNIASVVGLLGFRASNAYGVSKAGVVMMTRTMASEWAQRGIRVNCVAPGVIDAPMADAILDREAQTRDVFRRRIPMGRLGAPMDVAMTVAFLASAWATYITGALVSVDGGWAAFGGPGDASMSPPGEERVGG